MLALNYCILQLLSFNQVQTELPLTAMTADGKLRAEQAIYRIKERGQTNLSGGLLAALEALYRIKADDAALVESVLLFTDGKANVGIRDHKTIVKATKLAQLPGRFSSVKVLFRHVGQC